MRAHPASPPSRLPQLYVLAVRNTRGGNQWEVLKTYDDWLSLHESLAARWPSATALSVFPPAKWLLSETRDCVLYRLQQLRKYVAVISGHAQVWVVPFPAVPLFVWLRVPLRHCFSFARSPLYHVCRPVGCARVCSPRG